MRKTFWRCLPLAILLISATLAARQHTTQATVGTYGCSSFQCQPTPSPPCPPLVCPERQHERHSGNQEGLQTRAARAVGQTIYQLKERLRHDYMREQPLKPSRSLNIA